MKLRYRIVSGVFGTIAVTITLLAFAISYDAGCESVPAVSSGVPTMQAIVFRCYGSPDVLTLEQVPKPVPADNELLVKVQSAGVNPLDWHYMRGSPYLLRLMSGIGRPADPRVGVDFAGVVEAVGTQVTRFSPGDRVFGGRKGAFAEYVVVPDHRAVALMPDNSGFDDAASVAIAATTALQALRDKGEVRAGQKVLINGASGGVGTFAVQIAKSLGAEVTGVCSTRNVEMVRSIGADHVIDYKKESYTDSGQQFDLIIDMVGNHSLLDNRRAMTANGRLVMVGGPTGNWLTAFKSPIAAMAISPFVSQSFVGVLAELRQEDLRYLAELMRSGTLVPVIDKRYRLADAPDAVRYSESGRARGKIIIDL